jgi:hypothetical protein
MIMSPELPPEHGGVDYSNPAIFPRPLHERQPPSQHECVVSPDTERNEQQQEDCSNKVGLPPQHEVEQNPQAPDAAMYDLAPTVSQQDMEGLEKLGTPDSDMYDLPPILSQQEMESLEKLGTPDPEMYDLDPIVPQQDMEGLEELGTPPQVRMSDWLVDFDE